MPRRTNHLDDPMLQMQVFQVDPSWYERHWLQERPPSRLACSVTALRTGLTQLATTVGGLVRHAPRDSAHSNGSASTDTVATLR
jgi:hypothetical protein